MMEVLIASCNWISITGFICFTINMMIYVGVYAGKGKEELERHPLAALGMDISGVLTVLFIVLNFFIGG